MLESLILNRSRFHRNVSAKYVISGREEPKWRDAFEDVSFDIEPGQVVLIVGDPGSGKTTLLNLLTKVWDIATTGRILVDGQPLEGYNVHDLRRSMTIVTQSEEIYPLTLRENLLMGLVRPLNDDPKLLEKIDVAVQMAGASELVERIGLNKLMIPPGRFNQSNTVDAPVSQAALDELERCTPVKVRVSLTPAEQERITMSVLLCLSP